MFKQIPSMHLLIRLSQSEKYSVKIPSRHKYLQSLHAKGDILSIKVWVCTGSPHIWLEYE